jgi:hypothetical protein
MKQLRTYKSQIDKLKASLDRAKLMEMAKQRQEPTNDPVRSPTPIPAVLYRPWWLILFFM